MWLESYLAQCVFFLGQVVTSEILMSGEIGCPIEMYRIKINQCDEMYDRDCEGTKYMPFHRSGYDSRTGQSPNNPREQVSFHISICKFDRLKDTNKWVLIFLMGFLIIDQRND